MDGHLEESTSFADFAKKENNKRDAQVLREAVKLHAFDGGEFGDVVAVEDLINMANDIEAGL